MGGRGVLWDPGPTLWQPLDTLRHAPQVLSPRRHCCESQGSLSELCLLICRVPSAPKAMARAKGEGWMLSISPIQVKRGPLEPRQEPAPCSQLATQCHPAPETPRSPTKCWPQCECPAWSTRELNFQTSPGPGEEGSGKGTQELLIRRWSVPGRVSLGLLSSAQGTGVADHGPQPPHIPDQPARLGPGLSACVHPTRAQAVNADSPLYY